MFTVSELYRLSLPVLAGVWAFFGLLAAAFLTAWLFVHSGKGAKK